MKLSTTTPPHQASTPARPVISRRLASLIRRIDTELDLQPGHGFAEVILGDSVKELQEGDFSLVMDAWSFKDPEAARTALARIFPRPTPPPPGGRFSLRLNPGQRGPLQVRETAGGNFVVTTNVKIRKALEKCAAREGFKSVPSYIANRVVPAGLESFTAEMKGVKAS